MALFKRKRVGDAAAIEAIASDFDLTAVPDRSDDEYVAATGGLPDLPVVRQADTDQIADLRYGTIDGASVQLFSIRPTDEDSSGGRVCVAYGYTEVLLPEIYISPRGGLQKLSEKLQESGIAIGSTQLMAKYHIQAHSREHVRDVISVDTEDWLLACPVPGLKIEMRGTAMVGHAPTKEGTDTITPLFTFMRGLQSRIPEQTFRKYRML